MTVPKLKAGRDSITHLEQLSPEEILKTEVPTGQPRLYELDGELKVLKAEYL